MRGLVNEVRRELAHRLLRDTDLPVSEVAAVLALFGRYSVCPRVPALVGHEPP